MDNRVGMLTFNPGLWIWIDSVRIRSRHFSSIRIHKVIESGSSAEPDPQQTSLL
jgi:hypothetical protein